MQIYRQGCKIWSWSQILSKRTRQGGLFDNNGYGQHLKPIISKGHSSAVFWIFHQIFFLAFNSRDNTMLWVLNLFSRSSSTKLWKRIFKNMSRKIFLTLKVGKWWDCLILTPWERSNLSQKFRWKLFFLKKFLCSLNECAHVLHHPETVENF